MLTVSTYQEWKVLKLDDMVATTIVDCPECEDGIVYSTCSECGNESERDCETCENGLVEFGRLDIKQIDHLFTRKRYVVELKADLEKYEQATGKINTAQVLAENGFHLYTALARKWIDGEAKGYRKGTARIWDEAFRSDIILN